MAKTKEMLWSAGEALNSADLNQAQRFLRSQINDLWGGLARGGYTGGDLPEVDTAPGAAHVFCMGNGGAPYASASSRVLTNLGGWIAINTGGGDISGDDPEFLYYYLAAGELQTTLAVGDGSNPRYDILAVKLDHLDGDAETRHFKNPTTGIKSSASTNKRRNVRLQFEVKQGTPSASPSEPSPSAGYLKIASVYVPTGWNAVIDPDHILDHRMPVGLQVVDVPACQWDYISNSDSVTNWVLKGGVLGSNNPAVGNRKAYALCTSGGWATGRIVGVGFCGKRLASSTGALALVRVDMACEDTGYPEVDLGTAYGGTYNISTSILPAAGGDTEWKSSFIAQAPLWANGYRGGYAASRSFSLSATGAPPFSPMAVPRLAMRYEVDGTRQDSIMFARFYVAGGL